MAEQQQPTFAILLFSMFLWQTEKKKIGEGKRPGGRREDEIEIGRARNVYGICALYVRHSFKATSCFFVLLFIRSESIFCVAKQHQPYRSMPFFFCLFALFVLLPRIRCHYFMHYCRYWRCLLLLPLLPLLSCFGIIQTRAVNLRASSFFQHPFCELSTIQILVCIHSITKLL